MAQIQKTIASHYYTDPDYFQIDKEKIFYRTWQYVCHETDISEPGCFQTTRIADESIVVLRDTDGEIRAFYNVCRHRAHRIIQGEGDVRGKCRRLVCPYHAWTYELDGSLAHARGSEDVPGFEVSAIGLKPVRVENFCGLIFVNLDMDCTALGNLYPGLAEEILAMKPGLPKMILAHEDRITHECNWKVSVENFSECYHCAVVHKYITENLYSGTEYRISIDDNIVRHFSPRLKDRDLHGDLHIWFLWPNLAIQLHPLYRSISIRQFVAIGLRQTQYIYRWYADPDLPKAHHDEIVELGSSTYKTTNGAEDQLLVENVQLGLESRSYDTGALILPPTPAAESEHAVAFFHKNYLQAIDE